MYYKVIKCCMSRMDETEQQDHYMQGHRNRDNIVNCPEQELRMLIANITSYKFHDVFGTQQKAIDAAIYLQLVPKRSVTSKPNCPKCNGKNKTLYLFAIMFFQRIRSKIKTACLNQGL